VEKHIAAFHMIQAAYMPEVTCLVAAMSSGNDLESHPENQSLMLSSQLPPSTCTSNPGLADMECKLWYAQATDLIVELRQSLIMCAHLMKCKVDQVHGQNPNTCAQTLLNKAEAQMNRIVLKYTMARKSYLTLVGSGEWESVLKPLQKHNLCVAGGISPSYIESSINPEFSNVPIQIVTLFPNFIVPFIYSKRSMNSLAFKNTEM
jgi:hypothetical protein